MLNSPAPESQHGLAVLALNCGSSSLKFGLFQCEGDAATLISEGEAEEIGRENSSLWFRAAGQEKEKKQLKLPDHTTALAHGMDALRRCGAPLPESIGHRFVHGGPHIREHQRATAAVIDELRAAAAFAPLHLPAALSVLEAIGQKLPGVPQMVCLDTAFHRTMPDVSRTFALPAEVRDLGVERYGFHGLSLESILAQLERIPEKLVVAHLGNGASITAIRSGESIDTSMGLTPTGGVMMGTRCGDLDPGVLVYLTRNGYANPEMLEDLVDHRSGLFGVSGRSSDVRTLLDLRKQDAQVDLALRMFCYQVGKGIVGMAAALGGLDELVFTGGIGEHAAELRDEICCRCAFLGKFQITVFPSQEDLQIAKITARLAGS